MDSIGKYVEKVSIVGTPKHRLGFFKHTHKDNMGDNASTTTIMGHQSQMTTPVKRVIRVKNPFEQALAERLHLPLIGSPSLFQIPQTPQMSSTAFEWTIDDVSSLRPVNVEPCETQFQDSPDSDFEAKAQSAISSYFKEQIIVPSPIECPLRRQRIRLSEMNGVTPVAKTSSHGKHFREHTPTISVGTQTELSLPAKLPAELERLLAAYMQPVTTNSEEVEPTDLFKDTSLRRKLFDKQNVILLDGSDRPMAHVACSSPSTSSHHCIALTGILSDSMEKSSICSLSPISVTGGFSPSSESHPKQIERKAGKRKALDFMDELLDVEDLSPISRESPPKRHKLVYRTPPNHANFSRASGFEVSAENSLLTMSRISERPEMSEVDVSLNVKVKGLEVNESEGCNMDDDDVLMSGSSDSILLSTPKRGNAPSINGKNLSRSFSTTTEDGYDDQLEEAEEGHPNFLSVSQKHQSVVQSTSDCLDLTIAKSCDNPPQVAQLVEHVELIKSVSMADCDSGYNDYCSRIKEVQDGNDLSM